MTFELLIAKYGLLAVFLGAGIEGETIVILGGVFSHRHLMTFWEAAIAATAGSFIADQLFFFTGRHARRWPRIQRIAGRPAFQRATRLLERHPASFIFAFRFIYGLRTISPVAIGMSDVPTAKFMAVNAAAAVTWGTVFTAIGYLFGQGIEQIFGHLPLHRHVLIAIATAVALVIACALTYRKVRAA
jgi:membrane protein DedA with SNARE-associated domain